MDRDRLLIVATDTVPACHDTQQVEPLRTQLDTLPDELGKPVHRVVDTGYVSAANVTACGAQPLTPLIAGQREAHHPDPRACFTAPPPLYKRRNGGSADALYAHDEGAAALSAKRNCPVEPVIRIVKSGMQVRQCSLRGLEPGKGELTLVAMAWHLTLSWRGRSAPHPPDGRRPPPWLSVCTAR